MNKKRSKGSRIDIKKVRYHIHMTVANAASKNDKEDRSRIQNIKCDADLFPIGIDTFSSCMSNDIDHFETFRTSASNKRGKIKVANGGDMAVK